MEVRNINKTTGRKCECCSSWLGHWEKVMGESASICKAKNCTNSANVGAHVTRKINGDWRIVPFCYSCNKRTGWIELNKNTKTVSASHFSCI